MIMQISCLVTTYLNIIFVLYLKKNFVSVNEIININTAYVFQEEQEELNVILAKRNKNSKKMDEKPAEEKTTLHSKFC